MGKSATFLPVGKDFTNTARNFLPVGNAGLQIFDSQLPDRILIPAAVR